LHFFEAQFVIKSTIMKKWTFLMLMFLSNNSWAQYESIFGNVSTSWNVFLEIIDAVETDSLYIVGDTTINAIEYNIVKSQFNGHSNFIRESIDNNKVYLYSPVKDVEFLVLDLTLEEADTFRIGTDLTEILIVDSVYTIDSRKHIRFNYEIEFVPGIEKFEFIEGVGTNFGLFYQGIDPYYIGKYHYLLCAYKNAELFYSNKSFNGECNISIGAGIGLSPRKNNIKIYPNPTSEKINIEVKDLRLINHTLFLYNSYGRQIRSIILINSLCEIDVSNFPAGLYYTLTYLNGELIYDKIIITK